MMGLDGRKSFNIGLAVLIQYRRVRHPASQRRCRSTYRTNQDKEAQRDAFSGQSRSTNMHGTILGPLRLFAKRTCDRKHASPPRPPSRCKQRYGHAQHSAVCLTYLISSVRPSICEVSQQIGIATAYWNFFPHLSKVFSREAHGSLNFLITTSLATRRPCGYFIH